MINFYQYDNLGVFVRLITQSKFLPEPRNCTQSKPPETIGGQVAQWLGDGWEVLSARPSEPAPPLPTPAELKLTGIEILGVMCSATKEDQNGMIAIGFDKLTNTLAGTQMGSTTMEFENGSKLVITDENFSEVDALWRPFRKSFF